MQGSPFDPFAVGVHRSFRTSTVHCFRANGLCTSMLVTVSYLVGLQEGILHFHPFISFAGSPFCNLSGHRLRPLGPVSVTPAAFGAGPKGPQSQGCAEMRGFDP